MSASALQTAFDSLMQIVMEGRRKRHFLWTSPRNPKDFVMEQLLEDRNYMEIATWAINGSPYCRALLAHWASYSPEIRADIIADLNQRMNELDSHAPCSKCESTDLCSCWNGHCPACDDTLCEEYACRIAEDGAKARLQATFP
jgi:hypothetical protein